MPPLRLRRILFTTDYTALAERAFSHAAYLAATHDAALHVLHVVSGKDGDPLAPLDALRLTQADVAEQLGLPAPPSSAGPADAPVPVVEVERQGTDPAGVILDYAREVDVDLIVMGTHGRSGLERVRRGSVAETVVRQAPCPVLTVTAEAGPAGPVGRVLAPVDFSEPAAEAARHARALADLYGARLDLLHVVDEVLLRPVYVPLLGGFQVDEAEVTARAEAQLKALADALGGEAAVHVRVGHPALTIVDFAEAEGVGLVVIGSHGRSGLERLVLGSVAERVIRMAPCPVFTVRTFGRSLLPAERVSAAFAGGDSSA
ncbi:MAG TPA: universal stress protein [Rubricoccaceae bacterium]|nr:universal stress protein [Rubricoccaceae bacterium]